MIRRSRFPALLLWGVLLMLSCQFLRPARQSCRVNLPGTGWTQHADGDEITFMVDQTEWRARVDCSNGHLVDGQPVRPAGGRQTSLTVAGTRYKLITIDNSVSIAEYRENGSHIRIDTDDRYYIAVLSASSGGFGQAVIRYFMGGQAVDSLLHVFCYNRTAGEAHTSLLSISYMWSESKPVTVSLVCSAQNFILELSTDITPMMLKEGPTAPAINPQPTGGPAGPGRASGGGSAVDARRAQGRNS